ncbi:hypothetical protein GJAV_G00202580 [Gymnothorax javanicus]|nr:hypothetical protein GJAV_G00202580 [Gymnothorax javanicus]
MRGCLSWTFAEPLSSRGRLVGRPILRQLDPVQFSVSLTTGLLGLHPATRPPLKYSPGTHPTACQSPTSWYQATQPSTHTQIPEHHPHTH